MSQSIKGAPQDSEISRLAHEREAMAALAEEFRLPLVRYFSKRIKERNEIEDLVQEVFRRLTQRGNVLDLTTARGYVFKTAGNVLNDWLRRRRVRHADDHEFYEDEHHGSADFTPERVLIAKADLKRAVVILMELPERTRVIFALRRLEGVRYKDIAKRLGISLSAVEKHMRRAVVHLTNRLDE